MPLIFKQAKEILAKYAGPAGTCLDSPGLNSFVQEVLDYLLIKGTYGCTRKFCFNAIKGCITLPYELQTPLKMKVDCVVGSVWNKWFEYHETDVLSDCVPCDSALFEDPNGYPTVYDPPDGGGRIGATSACPEACDANLIVQGVDNTGREIVTIHDGKQIVGEYLSIKYGTLTYTQNTFAKVTGIVKTVTKGYVQLYSVNPDAMLKNYLADYSPLEELPSYRRYKLRTPCSPSVKLSVLGRIRLKQVYTDTDFIPFENRSTLALAGQTINSRTNTDIQTSILQDGVLDKVITQEAAHKTPQVGTPIEVFKPLSAGHVRNINCGWWGRS